MFRFSSPLSPLINQRCSGLLRLRMELDIGHFWNHTLNLEEAGYIARSVFDIYMETLHFATVGSNRPYSLKIKPMVGFKIAVVM